jgi:hypothetical protein
MHVCAPSYQSIVTKVKELSVNLSLVDTIINISDSRKLAIYNHKYFQVTVHTSLSKHSSMVCPVITDVVDLSTRSIWCQAVYGVDGVYVTRSKYKCISSLDLKDNR